MSNVIPVQFNRSNPPGCGEPSGLAKHIAWLGGLSGDQHRIKHAAAARWNEALARWAREAEEAFGSEWTIRTLREQADRTFAGK